MNTMNKIVTVICKICEILFWMLDGFMVVLTIASLFARDFIQSTVIGLIDDGSLSIEGMNFDLAGLTGLSAGRITATFAILFITGAIAASLGAMIFRNIYLIFRVSEGKSKHSMGATPFQPENVRMVREIGIFAIAIPAVQIVSSIIIQLVSGVAGNVTVNLNSVVFGFIVLCLSRYFVYGVELQNEVDGLL